MTIFDNIKKALGYRLGTPSHGGSVLQMQEMQIPPGWGYQQYLQAYGQIGWLFACVNVIAESVAKTPWHLYEIGKQAKRKEITEHPLIDLLNHINPYQSRYQFFYLATMYKKLVGEEFWQMNFLDNGKPGEIWLAPPAYMSVIPSATDYIDHYEYKAGAMITPIKFTTDEIIHIMSPNPYNPYRGLSEAQALTIDLDSDRFAARYQQKLFFNDATPGFLIEYPAADMPPAQIRQELMQEWDERFKGFRNRGRTGFLWGGKASTITMTNRDMDFEKLRGFTRDEILGAYKVPRSILGISEGVIRANAEAGHYTFAMYAVEPELAILREAMNKELCPFFGDNLYLDYENPIPEDMVQGINNVVSLFKASLITRDEARKEVDLPEIGGMKGGEFFPMQQTPNFGGDRNPTTPEATNPPSATTPLREQGKSD